MKNQIFSTVCRRLTLSYTLLFGLLSLGAFLLVYVHIVHNLNQQTDARLRATIREFSRTREENGRAGLQEEFIRESTATGKERIFFRLLDQDGRPVASSDLAAWKKLDRFPTSLAAMFNTMQERIAGLIDELKGVINNVAHDLRMPITRMRGIAETTLTRKADISSYRDMAVTVIEESDRLVGQINTILELAEIDAGLKVLAMEEVDLARIVCMAVELYQPAAEERNIELAVQLDNQPVSVTGNLNGLQRLLANLLDNGVKFTPAGGKITITLLAEADYAVLSVADNGPGIPKEDMEQIFDRFYRGDSSRSITGNGLGLALVKAIAQKHHGTVTVVSDGASGSCFVVRLPKSNHISRN